MFPKFQPVVVNLVNASGRQDWEAMPSLIEQCLYQFGELDTWLQWNLPLTACFEEQAGLMLEYDQVYPAMIEALDNCSQALSVGDEESLFQSLTELELYSQHWQEILDILDGLQKSLPLMSSQRVLNEIYILGLHHVKGVLHENESLVARLPILNEFYLSGKKAVEKFSSRYEDEKELVEHVSSALKELEMAMGGFFLYVSESRSTEDLSNALTLFDRAVRKSSAGLEAMQQVEYQHASFSETPLLERIFRLFKQEGQQEEKRKALVQLAEVQAQRSQDYLRWERTLMSESLYRSHLLVMKELFQERESLRASWTPENLDQESLTRYRDLGVKEDEKEKELDQLLSELLFYQPFEGLSEENQWLNYREWVATIKGVYEATLPDYYLDFFLNALESHLNEYWNFLENLALRQPDQAELIEQIKGVVELHHQVMASQREYLASSDRGILRSSYEQWIPATIQLMELASQLPPAEVPLLTLPSAIVDGQKVTLPNLFQELYVALLDFEGSAIDLAGLQEVAEGFSTQVEGLAQELSELASAPASAAPEQVMSRAQGLSRDARGFCRELGQVLSQSQPVLGGLKMKLQQLGLEIAKFELQTKSGALA